MPAIDIVSDANVALNWFHAEGQDEVPEARALVAAHQASTVALQVLDLTAYAVGNALLRGRAKATASQVATVLEALAEICQRPGPVQTSCALRPSSPIATTSPSTTPPTPRWPGTAERRWRRSIAHCSRRVLGVVRASSLRRRSTNGRHSEAEEAAMRFALAMRFAFYGCVPTDG
jgi:hypothetical protein